MSKIEEKTKIEISDELRERIKSFKEVIEAVIDEKMELNDCVEVILDRGTNLMLEKVLGRVEPQQLYCNPFNSLAQNIPQKCMDILPKLYAGVMK